MNPSGKNSVSSQWKSPLLVVSAVLMMAGLLWSRALLSSALIVFIAISLLHRQIIGQLQNFVSSPLLVAISILFFLPFVSGLWSSNIDQWAGIVRIKLPLLLLPICFAGNLPLQARHWEMIAIAFIVLMLASVGWSLVQYVRDSSAMHQAYLRAQTLPTALENDHVRFSLLADIAIVAAGVLLATRSKSDSRFMRYFLWTTITIFIVYLHILAVRTGLMCLYAGLFILVLWRMVRKSNFKLAVLLVLLPAFPFVAYFALPTFKNRMHYLKYDLSLLQNKIHVAGSNDGDRVASIGVGWHIVLNHPLSGVGFGDIRSAADSFYQKSYPGITEPDRILPSSEWMIYGDGTGWPGLMLFTLALIMPLFLPALRKNVVWWIINLVLVLSYVFDIGLEVQFGVFIHAFVVLWFARWLTLRPGVFE